MPEITRDRCITPSFSPSTRHRRKLMNGEELVSSASQTDQRSARLSILLMRDATKIDWRPTVLPTKSRDWSPRRLNTFRSVRLPPLRLEDAAFEGEVFFLCHCWLEFGDDLAGRGGVVP